MKTLLSNNSKNHVKNTNSLQSPVKDSLIQKAEANLLQNLLQPFTKPIYITAVEADTFSQTKAPTILQPILENTYALVYQKDDGWYRVKRNTQNQLVVNKITSKSPIFDILKDKTDKELGSEIVKKELEQKLRLKVPSLKLNSPLIESLQTSVKINGSDVPINIVIAKPLQQQSKHYIIQTDPLGHLNPQKKRFLNPTKEEIYKSVMTDLPHSPDELESALVYFDFPSECTKVSELLDVTHAVFNEIQKRNPASITLQASSVTATIFIKLAAQLKKNKQQVGLIAINPFLSIKNGKSESNGSLISPRKLFDSNGSGDEAKKMLSEINAQKDIDFLLENIDENDHVSIFNIAPEVPNFHHNLSYADFIKAICTLIPENTESEEKEKEAFVNKLRETFGKSSKKLEEHFKQSTFSQKDGLIPQESSVYPYVVGQKKKLAQNGELIIDTMSLLQDLILNSKEYQEYKQSVFQKKTDLYARNDFHVVENDAQKRESKAERDAKRRESAQTKSDQACVEVLNEIDFSGLLKQIEKISACDEGHHLPQKYFLANTGKRERLPLPDLLCQLHQKRHISMEQKPVSLSQ